MKIIKCDYCEKEMGEYFEGSHPMMMKVEPIEICEICGEELVKFKKLRKAGVPLILSPEIK